MLTLGESEIMSASSMRELPHEITPEDIRGIIWLLKKRPDGITEAEVTGGPFMRGKGDAYESLGIIVRIGDRLKLSPRGWEMARQLEPAALPFRLILSDTEQYRATLDWSLRHGMLVLTTANVSEHWRRLSPWEFGGRGQGRLHKLVRCFFDLCMAAGLGKVCCEEGEESPGLLLDREELAEFLTPTSYSRLVNARCERLTGRDKKGHARRRQGFETVAAKPALGSKGDRLLTLEVLSRALSEALEMSDRGEEPGLKPSIDLTEEVRRFETALIRGALKCAGGRQRAAARLLNMTKSTFNAKLKRYNPT